MQIFSTQLSIEWKYENIRSQSNVYFMPERGRVGGSGEHILCWENHIEHSKRQVSDPFLLSPHMRCQTWPPQDRGHVPTLPATSSSDKNRCQHFLFLFLRAGLWNMPIWSLGSFCREPSNPAKCFKEGEGVEKERNGTRFVSWPMTSWTEPSIFCTLHLWPAVQIEVTDTRQAIYWGIS